MFCCIQRVARISNKPFFSIYFLSKHSFQAHVTGIGLDTEELCEARQDSNRMGEKVVFMHLERMLVLDLHFQGVTFPNKLLSRTVGWRTH